MVYKRTDFRQLFFHCFPAACLLCSGPCCDGNPVCRDCRRQLTRPLHCCRRCGQALGNTDACGVCAVSPPGYDRLIAVYTYSNPVSNLIRDLKYRRRLLVARQAGIDLVSVTESAIDALPQCLLPVPLHRQRLRQRGFNQSLEIARCIADRLRIGLDARMLIRHRPTAPLFDLGRTARKRTLAGAFSLKYRPGYQHVALVDDVVTTGATASELAGLLKAAGVRIVEVWAFAQALGDERR